ncbi:MAG: MEKHLA domain-containing protein [Synechococcaceae bacterium WB6_3B_236]|jgi:hypothetical protein|nr:MEKHLA domain-containing protein [Synechococcaceae bacterium WB6_3B_236]
MSPAAATNDPPWLSPQILGLTSLVLDSHQRLYGQPLLRAQGSRLAAQELFVLDRVVLCHDGSADPRFIYANRAALQLFKRSWPQMVGLPSRLSARQQHHLDRRQALEKARRQEALTGYGGERVDSQGRRFQIRNARLWNLLDEERHYRGQAACFGNWWWEP